MALYFFDITDHSPVSRDEIGTECTDLEEVCKAARTALPHIAMDEIPANGEQQFFTVVARDTDGHAVYTATLSYAGLRLYHRT